MEAVCELYPDADLYTLVHLRGSVSETIESKNIHTSYVQRLPGKPEKFRRYLPLFPHAVRQFDLRGYDLVLSFSHCAAKGVRVPEGVPHICHCYTPMRYAWHMRSQYLSNLGHFRKWGAELLLGYLRNWDRRASAGVTHFIAISRYVQSRIRQAYDRDSTVIYPPVDCGRFAVSEDDDGYYLVVSALVPYKRVDLGVRAFGELEQKLVVIGNGPELERLRAMAPANVTFVENATDADVVQYMSKCRALIFPGEEDFGIVPLEAQACGKPVIAFGKGGALETIIGLDRDSSNESDATGVFFYEQDPGALVNAVRLFEAKRDAVDAQKCRDNAARFDRPRYKEEMHSYLEGVMAYDHG